MFGNPVLHTLLLVFTSAFEHQRRSESGNVLSFEVTAGGGTLVRRQWDEEPNATEEGNGSDVLDLEAAKADALRKEMNDRKTPSTAPADDDDANWHWKELGHQNNSNGNQTAGNISKGVNNTTNRSKVNSSQLPDECIETDLIYLGGELFQNSSEKNASSCQKRCQTVKGCAHWSYAPEGGSCFLQNSSAHRVVGVGMVSGIPRCEEPVKVIAVQPPMQPVKPKTQSCYQVSASYSPLDMPGTKRSDEESYDQCRLRCSKTQGCAHFSYFLEDKGCHLQNTAAQMVYLPGCMVGQPSCTKEDLMAFEEHIQQLPRVAKHRNIPCEDSWASFVPFDLPSDDLDEAGDFSIDTSATCGELLQQRRGPAGCKHSAQVRNNCPVLCGVCETSAVACADGSKDEAPLFLVGNETLNCTTLQDACHHDDEVDHKCKETCGFCTTKAAKDRPKGPSLESLGKIGCNRRRSMGYCFTRRRRLF